MVVTGATSGIGRATTRELVRRGVTVAAVAREPTALCELADQARTSRGEVVTYPSDVADEDRLRQVADDVVRRDGHLDVWINNASVALFGALDRLPVEDVHRVVDVNLGGYLHGCRAALPRLRAQDRGIIINVSSVLGLIPAPFQIPYVVTKHGIHGLNRALRQEVRGTSVAVCAR